MRELTPKEQVRLPTGLRCESETCKGRVRRFEAVTGIQASFLIGRHVVAKCRTCGAIGLVEA